MRKKTENPIVQQMLDDEAKYPKMRLCRIARLYITRPGAKKEQKIDIGGSCVPFLAKKLSDFLFYTYIVNGFVSKDFNWELYCKELREQFKDVWPEEDWEEAKKYTKYLGYRESVFRKNKTLVEYKKLREAEDGGPEPTDFLHPQNAEMEHSIAGALDVFEDLSYNEMRGLLYAIQQKFLGLGETLDGEAEAASPMAKKIVHHLYTNTKNDTNNRKPAKGA